MGYDRQKADLGRHLEERTTEAVLPTQVSLSPAKLCRWGPSADPSCKLCDRPGTLEHVLYSCSTALPQGRFRWRHDNVLREVADLLETERKKDQRGSPQQRHINCVKPGEAAKPHSTTKDINHGWYHRLEHRSGPKKKRVFPGIVKTNLRPDIVLWSETGKKLIMIKLTVPWETR